MSFAKKMRARQGRGVLTTLALAASVAMGAGAAPPPAFGASAPTGQQASKDYADVRLTAAKKTVKRRRTITGGSGRGQVWHSRHSARRIIMRMARRENSGRQWIRVRRVLRHSPLAWLLSASSPDLLKLSRSNKLTFNKKVSA